MAQVLYLKDTQDRKYMTDENQAIEEYKRNCEYHRLLRKYCGPNAYSVFTALVDRASQENDGWCWPSYELLMEDTGMGNRNAITTALEILFDLGLIEWQLNGRHALYKPVKKVNSTELILFNRRAEQYQNDTKDSIKTVRSIVSKRYSNVYQSNVNQINELTTPKGVAAPPSKTIDFTDNGFYQEKEPEPPQEQPLTDALLPDTLEATTQPGPATDKGRAGANSVHIPSSPQLDLAQEVKGFEAEGGGRDMTHVGKARDKPGPKSKAKEPDEKEKPGLHIALMTYKKEFRSLPHKRQLQGIIDQVGDNPDRLVKWGKACHNWVMRGWDPFNVAGLLDSFEKGNYENDHFKQQRGQSLGLDSREKQLDQRPRVLTGTGWGGGKSGEELQAEWDNYKL